LTHRLGQSATPIPSGGTEPPSRHLSCARLPLSARRCRSVSSKLFDSPEPHSPHGPLADWASVRFVPHLTVSRFDTPLTLRCPRPGSFIQHQLFLAAYLPAPGPQLSKEAFQLRDSTTLVVLTRFLGIRQGQALRFIRTSACDRIRTAFSRTPVPRWALSKVIEA